jgi:hypothetical protein
MNNSNSRVTLMTLFCFTLSACGIGIKSTNLKDTPANPNETRLLKSVGYVFHSEVFETHDKSRKGNAYHMESTHHKEITRQSEIKYIQSEQESWIDALSSFTDKENIFVMSNGRPVSIINPASQSDYNRPNTLFGNTDQENILAIPDSNPANQVSDRTPESMMPDSTLASVMPDSKPVNAPVSFAEFAKTHPVVDVYVKAAPEKPGLTSQDAIYGTPTIVSFFSFGIIPAYFRLPYTASFTLSMPEEKHIPPAHWDYSYDRQEYYWLPIFIPMADYINTFMNDDEIDARLKAEEKRRIDALWKTEEKRRLVLRFLHDAKPLLQKR